jgi:hypothetical protein
MYKTILILFLSGLFSHEAVLYQDSSRLKAKNPKKTFLYRENGSLLATRNPRNAEMISKPDTIRYDRMTALGENLFAKKKYREALTAYNTAIAANNDMGRVIHRYKVASCYALLGIPDSAFYQLDRIAIKGRFSGIALISNDYNFISLFNDARWERVLSIIRKNSENEN